MDLSLSPGDFSEELDRVTACNSQHLDQIARDRTVNRSAIDFEDDHWEKLKRQFLEEHPETARADVVASINRLIADPKRYQI